MEIIWFTISGIITVYFIFFMLMQPKCSTSIHDKMIETVLERLLRGGSLTGNYVSLKNDLRYMDVEEKHNLIEKTHSDSNVEFSENETWILNCIISKIIFDVALNNVRAKIAKAMAETILTPANYGWYYRKYEIAKLNALDTGINFMINNLKSMYNCKDKDSLLKFLGTAKIIFYKYIDALKEHFSFNTMPLKELMTKEQDITEINREKNDIISATKQMHKNPYEIMEVSPSASKDEIRKSYYRLVKIYHPDVNDNTPEAEQRMKEINEAYSILSNPKLRKQLDDTLDNLNPFF